MSQEILIQELHRKSSDKIREMWNEAKKKAERMRSVQEEEYAQIKKTQDGRLQEIMRDVAAPIIHNAEIQALQTVDDAMRKLAERLYEMAQATLPQVREKDYRELFAALVRELPESKWESVKVGEPDKELARSFFPDAEIRTDPSLVGGFVVSVDNGRYQVINTLERRLEKAWPYVLPSLIEDIA